jgi:hypothetical protein
MLPLLMEKKMLVWVILPPILMLQKNIQPFYIVKVTTRCVDTVLFFPLEFSINGC